MDDYTLQLAGQDYAGWKSLSLTRSMEVMSGSFRLSLSGRPEEKYVSSQLMIGAEAEVNINGNAVLVGYVDVVENNYGSQASDLYVSGRDKVADLIDCAATVDGPFEYNGQRLNQILATVLKPYGIGVTYEADTGAAFKRMAIQPGETAFEFIERLCRYRSVLPVSDGLGGLIITKPGIEKSNGRLVYGQNILNGRIYLDGTGRFSLVVVKGQEEGTEDNDANVVAGGEGRAVDKLVTRYRPKVMTGEQPDSSLGLQERAEWEVAMARARSVTATYVVQGWTTDGKADLWKINTIVNVKDAARGLDRDMLIKSVTFDRGSNGSTTTLELVLPEAFNLPAESEPEGDLLGGV